MPRDFPALPGLYQILFFYFEPVAIALPVFVAWFAGAEWLHAQLVPGSIPVSALDARTKLAVWQLCYMILALVASFAYRAIRDTLPDNPEAQERILGAILIAVSIADVMHIIATLVCLPEDVRYSPGSWNQMTYGNTFSAAFILGIRLAWFAGIGRQRYYYGKAARKS